MDTGFSSFSSKNVILIPESVLRMEHVLKALEKS